MKTEKLTKNELTDRIYNKAWTKLQGLKRERVDLYHYLANGHFKLSSDLIRISIASNDREIQVWTEILRLNEIQNKTK